MAGFRYFMLRVRHDPDREPAGSDALSGVVERLGSWEKHGFASAQELLHLLGTWTESASNMPSAPPLRNDEPAQGLKEKHHGDA